MMICKLVGEKLLFKSADIQHAKRGFSLEFWLENVRIRTKASPWLVAFTKTCKNLKKQNVKKAF